MEIVKVKFSKNEANEIYNELIARFETSKARHNKTGHEVCIHYGLFDIYATLNLFVDEMEVNPETKELNTDCTVLFYINMYYNGVSVEGLEDTDIEDRIKAYSWIKPQQL